MNEQSLSKNSTLVSRLVPLILQVIPIVMGFRRDYVYYLVSGLTAPNLILSPTSLCSPHPLALARRRSPPPPPALPAGEELEMVAGPLPM